MRVFFRPCVGRPHTSNSTWLSCCGESMLKSSPAAAWMSATIWSISAPSDSLCSRSLSGSACRPVRSICSSTRSSGISTLRNSPSEPSFSRSSARRGISASAAAASMAAAGTSSVASGSVPPSTFGFWYSSPTEKCPLSESSRYPATPQSNSLAASMSFGATSASSAESMGHTSWRSAFASPATRCPSRASLASADVAASPANLRRSSAVATHKTVGVSSKSAVCWPLFASGRSSAAATHEPAATAASRRFSAASPESGSGSASEGAACSCGTS